MWVEEVQERRAVVNVQGPLNRIITDTLKTTLQVAAEKGSTQFVLDMGEVDFIDSSGLSALVDSLKMIRNRQGKLVFANVRPKLKIVLELSRLNQVFTLYDDVTTALASFSESPADAWLRHPPLMQEEPTRKPKRHPLLGRMQKVAS